jgi:hypothetical protein
MKGLEIIIVFWIALAVVSGFCLGLFAQKHEFYSNSCWMGTANGLHLVYPCFNYNGVDYSSQKGGD